LFMLHLYHRHFCHLSNVPAAASAVIAMPDHAKRRPAIGSLSNSNVVASRAILCPAAREDRGRRREGVKPFLRENGPQRISNFVTANRMKVEGREPELRPDRVDPLRLKVPSLFSRWS